jgi:hypothetical protein
MSTSFNGDLSHGLLLSDSLQRLQLEASSNDLASNGTDNGIDSQFPSPPSRLLGSVLHEGYGFRPASGSSTPPSNAVRTIDSPLPDRHGLGWPGVFFKLSPVNPKYLCFSQINGVPLDCNSR